MDDNSDQKQPEWTYEADTNQSTINKSVDKPISWTASEYIAHEKSMFWYISLISLSLILSAIIFFITSDAVTAVAIMTVALTGVFFAGRKPDVKTYEISNGSIKVEDKSYNLAEFKAFSIVEEGAIDSIWLNPLARLKPMLVVYFPPEDKKDIAEALGQYLAYEERKLDVIDKFASIIRF